jgi:hypothetical protein
MSSLKSDYTGCIILVYDVADCLIGSTTAANYDKKALRMELRETPPDLSVGNVCRLLILSSPSPCEYQGRVISAGEKKAIAMFQGKEKEDRGAVRYNVNHSALIEYLISDGRAHPLHTPLEVELVNISKSGVRIRAPVNAMSDGDRFQMRLKISSKDKLLITEALYHMDKCSEVSEYGCRFLVGSGF